MLWRVWDSHSEDEGGEAFGEEQPLPAVQAADVVQRQQARRQGGADDLRDASKPGGLAQISYRKSQHAGPQHARRDSGQGNNTLLCSGQYRLGHPHTHTLFTILSMQGAKGDTDRRLCCFDHMVWRARTWLMTEPA